MEGVDLPQRKISRVKDSDVPVSYLISHLHTLVEFYHIYFSVKKRNESLFDRYNISQVGLLICILVPNVKSFWTYMYVSNLLKAIFIIVYIPNALE